MACIVHVCNSLHHARVFILNVKINSIILSGVNAILSVDETEITENSATLTCELPCFSSNLQCVVSRFMTCCTDVNVTNSIGDITGSVMTYSYPTHTITLSGLNSDTTYNYCIVVTNITNMIVVGKPVCGSFTTWKITSESNDSKYVGA